MIEAERLQKQFENKSIKENKSTIKLEERKIWLDLGDEKRAKQCLKDALSVETKIDKQITIILEHSMSPGEAIDSAVKLIPKNSKTNNGEKISILRYMLRDNNYEELSNSYTLHRVINDWIKDKGVKDNFDKEEIGLIIELSGKRDANKIVTYYQKVKPPTRWSLEGYLRWIDPYIEATEEIARTKDHMQKFVVEGLKREKEEYEDMLSTFEAAGDNDSKSSQAYTNSELKKMSKGDLKKLCEQKELDQSGKKSDLIKRLSEN